jgi:hypothetical protein
MKAWDQCGAALEAAIIHADLKADLKRLLAAMEKRIATGAYGLCRNCSAPIPAERLRALPWAEFCATCEDVPGAPRPDRLSETLTRETGELPLPANRNPWERR